MKRHYLVRVKFFDDTVKDCYVPIKDIFMYPAVDQVIYFLLTEYSRKLIKSAYLIQKSSKRVIRERVM